MLNYSLIQSVLSSDRNDQILSGLTELKEKYEIFHSPEATIFLQSLFDSFMHLLAKLKPQIDDNEDINSNNKIRLIVLEIISRYPQNDTLKPYASRLMSGLLNVLINDNEDNALVAIKLICDLHKMYRPSLEPHVQPFLELVHRLYINIQQIANCKPIHRVSNSSYAAVTDTSTGTTDGTCMKIEYSSNTSMETSFIQQQQQAQTITISSTTKVRGLESYKVLTECPLICMLLFQFYPQYLKKNLLQLIPLMMHTLSVKPPDDVTTFQRLRNRELLLAQVKTLSFVTYLLRGYADLVRQCENSIAISIYNMLSRCPDDAIVTRKELLIATRHIIATEFRRGLFMHIDDFLTKETMLGSPKCDLLKPLAYTTLADLLSYAKELLNASQLTKVVELYNGVLNDNSLPTNIHAIAVKLLLGLVDKINQYRDNSDSSISASLLFTIFRGLVGKLRTLKRRLLLVDDDSNSNDTEALLLAEGPTSIWFKKMSDQNKENAMAVEKETMNTLVRFDGSRASDSSSRDTRLLLRAICTGMKSLIQSIDNIKCTDISAIDRQTVTKNHVYFDKISLLKRYIKWTTECCLICLTNNSKAKSTNGSSNGSSNNIDSEIKDLLDSFANALTLLHADTFRMVIRSQIKLLCEITTKYQIFLAVFQQLFSSAQSSPHATDITLSYFLSSTNSTTTMSASDIGIWFPEKQNADLLRLFKLMLSSITLFPENEKILLGRLPRLIISFINASIRTDVTSSNSTKPASFTHIHLLKVLFKSISLWKLEQSMQAIFPYYQSILNALECLYHRHHGKVIRSIIIELCLSIPSKPATQISHLQILFRWIPSALNSQSDIANLALKCLDTWLEQTTIEGFTNEISCIPGLNKSIIAGILQHLKPVPYQVGLMAFRILGKLGVYGRKSFRDMYPSNSSSTSGSVSTCGNACISMKYDRDLITLNGILNVTDGVQHPIDVNLAPIVIGACEILKKISELVDADISSSSSGSSNGNDGDTSLSSSVPSSIAQILKEASESSHTTGACPCTRGSSIHSKPIASLYDDWQLVQPDVSEVDEIEWKQMGVEAHYVATSVWKVQKKNALDVLLLAIGALIRDDCDVKAVNYSDNSTFHVTINAALASTNDVSFAVKESQKVDLLMHITAALVTATCEDSTYTHHDIHGIITGLLTHYAMISTSSSDRASLYHSIVSDVIIETINDTKLEVSKKASTLLKEWLMILSTTSGGSDSIATLVASNDVIARLCRQCKSDEVYERIASIKLISDLCLYDAGVSIIVQRIEDVVDALLYVSQHPNGELMAPMNIDLLATVKAVVACYSKCTESSSSSSSSSSGDNGNSSSSTSSISDRLVIQLGEGMFNRWHNVRVIAKAMINEFALSTGTTEYSMFASVPDHFHRKVHTEIERLKYHVDVAFLCGLEYFLGISIISIDSSVVSTYIASVIDTIQNDVIPSDLLGGFRPQGADNSLDMTYQNQIPIPLSIELQVLLVKVIRSVFKSIRTNTNDNSAFLGRCCSYLLKSLSNLAWPEVLDETKLAIETCIGNEHMLDIRLQYLNKSVIEENFKYVFNAVQDVKLLSCVILKNFEVILKLVPDIFSYEYFVPRFMNYLRLWCEPEKIIAMNAFHPGCEYRISLTLVKILLSIPITTSQFLEELIMIIIDLDQSHHRFKLLTNLGATDDCYMLLLLDLLMKYPVDAMLLFFSQNVTTLAKPKICDPRVVDTLIKLSNLPMPYCDQFKKSFLAAGGLTYIDRDIYRPLCPDGLKLTDATDIELMTSYCTSSFLQQLLKSNTQLFLEYPDIFILLRVALNRIVLVIAQNQQTGGHDSTSIGNSSTSSSSSSSSSSSANIRLQSPPYLLHNSVLFLEAEIVCKCLIMYFRTCPIDIDILFALITILNTPLCPVDFTFLIDFMSNEMHTLLLPQQKRMVLQRYYASYAGCPVVASEWKVKSMQLLIIPLTIEVFQRKHEYGNSIVDADMIVLIMKEAYGATSATASNAHEPALTQDFQSADDGATTDTTTAAIATTTPSTGTTAVPSASIHVSKVSDALKVELLKLSTILLDNCSELMKAYKKDLIKFPWNSIKADDVSIKYWSYVNICCFIASFESPAKIIIQIYVALLRSCPVDGKEVIKLAIDILLPVLTKRLSSDEMPKIIKWTKKILLEEGMTNLPLLSHIWNIIIRHNDTFYPFRAQLVPQMVNTITRIGLPPTSAIEYRQVSLAMADVIIGWEWYNQHKLKKRELPVSCTSGGVSGSGSGGADSSDHCTSETYVPLFKKGRGGQDGSVVNAKVSYETSTTIAAAAPVITAPDTDRDGEFQLHASMLPFLATFLVRLAFFLVENKDTAITRMYPRCIHLYRAMIALQPTYDSKLSSIDKMLVSSVEAYYNSNGGSAPSSGTGTNGSSTSTSSSSTNSSSNSNANSVGNKALTASGNNSSVSESVLITVLTYILLTAQSTDGLLKVFMRNMMTIKDLIIPIFESENPKVLKLFRSIIIELLNHKYASHHAFIDSEFFSHLKYVIEKGLKLVDSRDKDRQTNTNSSSSVGGVGGGGNSSSGNSSTSSAGLTSKTLLQSLQFIYDISQHVPEWIDYFATRLIKACHQLYVYHAMKALRTLRSDALQSFGDKTPGMYTQYAHPVPWISPIDAMTQSLSKGIDVPATFYIALKCIYRGFDHGYLLNHKASVISLVYSILETSDSPVVLYITLEYLVRWVAVTSGTSPLSYTEQWDMYENIISSSGRLPETASYPHYLRIYYLADKMKSLCINSPKLFTSYYGVVAFNSMNTDWGSTGFMCSIESVRSNSLYKSCNKWGKGCFDKLSSFFRSDLSQLGSKYYTVILPFFFFNSIDGSTCVASTDNAVKLNSIFSDTTSSSVGNSVGISSKTNKRDVKRYDDSNPYAKLLFIVSQSGCDSVSSSGAVDKILSLCMSHATTGESVWQELFITMWDKLSIDQQTHFTHSIETCITTSRPKANLLWSSSSIGAPANANVVQSLLQVFDSCSTSAGGVQASLPTFNVELLGAIGKEYAAWYQAEALLEAYRTTAVGNSSSSSSSSSKVSMKRSLYSSIQLLDDVGDAELIRHTMRLYSNNKVMNVALSYECYDHHHDAQDMLLKVMKSHANESADTVREWERRWIDNSKELSDWTLLAQVADSLSLPDIKLEAAVYKHDWQVSKQMRSSPLYGKDINYLSLEGKLRDIAIAIADSNISEAERLFPHSIQIALLRWKLLPTVSPGSAAHSNILLSFQRIVELRESAGTLTDAAKSPKDRATLEGKIQKAWKQRLPDPSEGLHVCGSLINWRHYVFKSIKAMKLQGTSGVGTSINGSMYANTISGSSANNSFVNLTCSSDAVSTVLALVNTARQSDLSGVGLQMLSTLHSTADRPLQVYDEYTILRERVLSYMQMSSKYRNNLPYLYTAMNLLVTTSSLEFFDQPQLSEYYRLKGMCERCMYMNNEAQLSFSKSLQYHGNSLKAWLCWAAFCYDQYRLSGSLEMAASTIVCTLKAISLDSKPARLLQDRIISLVVHEDVSDQLSISFQTYSYVLPAWVWIPNLHDLIVGYTKYKVETFKLILLKIAELYPNSILFNFIVTAGTSGSTSSSGSSTSAIPVVLPGASTVTLNQTLSPAASHHLLGDELFNILRVYASSGLINEATRVSSFIANNIDDTSAAEVLHTILSDFSDELMSDRKHTLSSSITQTAAKAFISAINRYTEQHSVSDGDSVGGDSGSDCRGRSDVTRVLSILRHVREELKLSQAKPIYITTITRYQLLELVTRWRRVVYSEIMKMHRYSNTSNVCETLYSSFSYDDSTSCITGGRHTAKYIEVPGQYQEISFEPRPYLHVKLVRVIPLSMVRVGAAMRRQFIFVTSDGKASRYTAYAATDADIHRNHRFKRLNCAVNCTLKKNVHCRKRDMSLLYSRDSLVTSSILLHDHSSDEVSLSDMYEQHCVSNNSSDMPLVDARQVNEDSHEGGSKRKDTNVTTVDRIESYHKRVYTKVPNTLLGSYLSTTVRMSSHNLVIKRFFSCQLGIHSAMQYMLRCPASSEQFKVTPGGGIITGYHDYQYSDDGDGGDSAGDIVPFRVTNVIENAMSKLSLHGVLPQSIGNTLNAVVNNIDVMEVYIYLYYFDSLMMEHDTKPSAQEVKECIARACVVAKQTVSRLKVAAPSYDLPNYLSQSSIDAATVDGMVHIDAKVEELLAQALDDEYRINKSSDQWQPWL